MNEILQSIGFRERVTGEWEYQTPSDPEARRRQFDNVDALAVDLELLRHELPMLLDGQHPVYPRCSIAPASSPSAASTTASAPSLSSVPHTVVKSVPSTSTSAPPLPLVPKPVVAAAAGQPMKKLYAPRKPRLSKANGDAPPAPTSNKCPICGDVVEEFFWCKECAASGDPRGKKLLCAGCKDRRHQPGNKDRENHTFVKVAAAAPEPDTPPPAESPQPASSAPSFKGFPKASAHLQQPQNNLDEDDEYHSANEGEGEVQIEDASGGPASGTRNRTAAAASARKLMQSDASVGRLSPSDGMARPAIVLNDDEMIANRRILTLVKACAAERPPYSIVEVRYALTRAGNDTEKVLLDFNSFASLIYSSS